MKFTISKSQWENMGRQTGWLKTALNKGDGIADGGEPYTDEEMDLMQKEDEGKKRLSFTYGTTPEKIITERTMAQTPSGYPMTIRNDDEWAAIYAAGKQGIDSYLEAFTRSKFGPNGKCLIHPEEMKTLLRRLTEGGTEAGMNLRSAILETLGVEEI